MARRRTTVGAALLGLTVAGVGLAPPATATYPGENGLMTYAGEVQWLAPCMGSPMDDPPGPLSVQARDNLAWSADGLRFAISTDTSVLVVAIEDCSVDDLGAASSSGVAWSPDGSLLAVVRDGDVVLISSSTGELVTEVTDTAFTERRPTWDPDGGTVAYEGEGGIRVAAVDGSTPEGTLLVPGGVHPDYSPDGERIAYTTAASELTHARASDGGDAVVVPGFEAYHLTWSPDGQHFLFAGDTGDGSGPDCYVTDLEGTVVEALGVVPAPCSNPSWQPLPADETPDLTLVYLYRKVDLTRRPSWGNSGPQQLFEVLPGHTWLAPGSLSAADLPDDVCGPGWAVQTDQVVDLAEEDVPEVIDRATWTNVLGWGTTVQAARHHSLEFYADVPDC